MANQHLLARDPDVLLARGQYGDALEIARQIAADTASVTALLGAARILRHAGEAGSARTLTAEAARRNPGDAEIGNIHANTLAEAGDLDQALALFDTLIADHPHDAAAHINRAMALLDAGDAERALGSVDNGLAALPRNARLWSLRGVILKNLGELGDAVAAFDRAIELEPDRARSYFNLGVALRAMEDNRGALAAYSRAEQLGMTGVAIAGVKAAALVELGRVEEARSLYFTAFAAGDREAGEAITRLDREYLGAEDAFTHYRARADAVPNEPRAWHEWLGVLHQYREFQRLAEASAAALKHHPGDPRLAAWAAGAALYSGNAHAGLTQFERLVARYPGDAGLHLAVAEAALICQAPKRAESAAQRALDLAPGTQTGWAYLGTAWRMLGDPRETWLCDYDTNVVTVEVFPCAGHASAPDYAAEIAQTLAALHVTRAAPGNQSVRLGTQTTGALFARQEPALRDFRDAILEAVNRAVSQFSHDPAHPFTGAVPDPIEVRGSWSVRLTNAGGHHAAHFHSEGWASSAYYARLPDITRDDAGDEGCIAFGAPPVDWNLGLGPRRVVRPRVGTLVLFPSFMWHNTVPFTAAGERLTAAFDFA